MFIAYIDITEHDHQQEVFGGVRANAAEETTLHFPFMHQYLPALGRSVPGRNLRTAGYRPLCLPC